MQRSAPKWPRFLWHYRVHRDRVGEQLLFLRVDFAPVFDRDLAEAGVRAACAAHGVRGVISYELFGPADLLLRVWLPRATTARDFQETLRLELEPAGEAWIEPFAVEYAVRHFLFADSSGKPLLPQDAALHHLQTEEILQIEAGFPDDVSPQLLRRVVDEHLLAPFHVGPSPDLPGIKFAIVISGAPELSRAELIAFEGEIVKILDAATGIAQRSLYAGFGFGHFLIMGRVHYAAFHHIHTNLVTQINTAALRAPFQVNTETHISGQRGYHIAEERLSGVGALDAADAGVAHAVPARRGVRADEAAIAPLAPGDLFARRFEIRARLGRGGFATVYRAWDMYEKVDRAIKLFNSPDPEVALRELQALRRVEHPNIVKALWFDNPGGRLYLVAEFIEGHRLSDIDKDALTDLRALEIMDQVLAALEALHPKDQRIGELKLAGRNRELSPAEFGELQRLSREGLIHRDIKPDNIMVGEDGLVKLVDFNIATPARDPKSTRTGTPRYQAPDAGEDRWEPADDLFACGVVLYELLADAHPFVHRNGRPTSAAIDIRTRRPDLSAELASIVMSACSPSRADRYKTAREMRSDLRRQLPAVRGAGTEAGRIGRILGQRREDLGLTRGQLATKTGLGEGDIEGFEDARVEPTLTEALALAQALELDLARLLEGREGEPRAHPDAGREQEAPPRERRRFRRVPASLPAQVIGQDARDVPARTQDIGAGGVLLAAAAPFAQHEHVRVVIELAGSSVAGDGDVVRAGEGAFAVRFARMAPQDEAELQRFISERSLQL